MGEGRRGVDELLQKLALRVRRRRKELGLSQEALALKAGLQRSHVGHVEQAKRDVRFSTLVKLAFALGIDLGELLKGIELTHPPDAR
ncbi:MAG TPA: helix-turn-helix transcriptional regulator [Acidimicrobiales bacterium]|nr:helix-turn-helix transcriptional regulator [Acidimicrobiales bacterium]